MDAFIIRAIVALLVALLLVRQAIRAPARSRNRSSCWLGAAGFGMVALLNGMAALGLDIEPLAVPMTIGATALLVASVFMLLLAYREGEMNAQLKRARQMIAEERERRKP